jgi:hypothetical protein
MWQRQWDSELAGGTEHAVVSMKKERGQAIPQDTKTRRRKKTHGTRKTKDTKTDKKARARARSDNGGGGGGGGSGSDSDDKVLRKMAPQHTECNGDEWSASDCEPVGYEIDIGYRLAPLNNSTRFKFSELDKHRGSGINCVWVWDPVCGALCGAVVERVKKTNKQQKKTPKHAVEWYLKFDSEDRSVAYSYGDIFRTKDGCNRAYKNVVPQSD